MLQPSPHPRKTIPRRSSASQNHAAFAFSSPTKGVDVTAPLPMGKPLTAIRMDNLIPRALGCELRSGYRHWVGNMGTEIRSLMQYIPAVGAPKQFAANDAGQVFDVTAFQLSPVVPVPVLTIGTGVPQGEWHSLNFTNEAGDHFLVAVNPGGGYWVYDGTTWTEKLIADFTSTDPLYPVPDPKTFSFVTVYKKSLVFIQRDSSVFWFLKPDFLIGPLTPMDMGAVMPHGGYLAGIANWTFDGSGSASASNAAGGGMDNKMVIISSQGDVLVYSGTLISDEEIFQLVGRWFVGRVPPGHRFFSQYASDVAILSERGLAFMSELMRGDGFFSNSASAAMINPELSKQITASINMRYWEVKFLPHEQLIIIKLPKLNNSLERQWVYEVNTKAFCGTLGMPMMTVNTFDGHSYFGDDKGNVWLAFAGQSDGEVDGVQGKTLEGMLVTSFQSLGDPVRLKRFLMVKPSFIAQAAPGVQVRLNKEWDIGLPNISPAFVAAGDSFWDVGLWDTAVWSGSDNSYESWTGAAGVGRYGSMSLRVRGAAGTVLVSWQALVEQGGIL